MRKPWAVFIIIIIIIITVLAAIRAVPSTSGSPTNRWSAVRGGLDAVELRVLTISGHQLIVGAALHQPGPVEHDDEIRHADRRETVRDEDREASAIARASAARRCGVVFKERVFSLRVQRGGGFVENQH